MKTTAKFLVTALTLAFLFCICLSPIALAASGDAAEPFSGYTVRTLPHDPADPNSLYTLQLMNVYRGDDARNKALLESPSNPAPGDDEEWILLKFHICNLSGDTLGAYEVLSSQSSFYLDGDTPLEPITFAVFTDGLDENGVELSPGQESDVWYGFLVKKPVRYLLYFLTVGYDQDQSDIPAWFTTAPSDVPVAVKATCATYCSVSLTWDAVNGAAGYNVYRSLSQEGPFDLVASPVDASYMDTAVDTDSTYYYQVQSFIMAGGQPVSSDMSSTVFAKPVLKTPASPKAASASYNSIKLSWGASTDASGYEVYRATASAGAYKLVKSLTGTSFTDPSLATNTNYYYKVRAYTAAGATIIYSDYTTAYAKPVPAAPASVKAAAASGSSAKISWAAAAGATKYEVYRSAAKTGTYSLLTSTASLSYINTKLTKGRTYYFKVRVYRLVGTAKVYSAFSAIVSAKP